MTSVALLGVKGGPAIHPGSNMPTSLLVQIAGLNILVDPGLGATGAVCGQGIPLPNIDLVLVTHLHSDHYLELGAFFHTAWVAGLKTPIPVIGPLGLSHYWTHFCASMDSDISLREVDEGRTPFAPLAEISEIAEGVIFQRDEVQIRAMKNLHPPIEETFALRFETTDHSVVLSGDTAFMPEMIEFAKGADLLVHEAMLVEGVDAIIARVKSADDRLREHILRSHTSASDVGRIAHSAGVKQLALNHFVPDGHPDFTETAWINAVREHWSGPLHIGRDGMRIEIQS